MWLVIVGRGQWVRIVDYGSGGGGLGVVVGGSRQAVVVVVLVVGVGL